jgi:hypothetical protein
MIETRLKQCCYKCNYPDVEVESRTLGLVFDEHREIQCTIYCAHEKVCKQYLESGDE